MNSILKKEKYNGWTKKLFYVLVVVILLEIIYLFVARMEHSRPRFNYCSQAYNCKIDEKNPEVMNCNYVDNDGNESKDTIKCLNSNYEENSYE